MVILKGPCVAAFCTLFAVVYGAAPSVMPCAQPGDDQGSIYDFTMLDITRTKNISLSDYRGKVVLVVNVATY